MVYFILKLFLSISLLTIFFSCSTENLEESLTTVTTEEENTNIDCGTPQNIENGSLIYTDTTYGSTATVSCNNGFQSKVGSVKCQVDSNWESTTCDAITNPIIPEPLPGLLNKETALQLYRDEYLGSEYLVSGNNWSGYDRSSCFPGSIENLARAKALKRLNYFRSTVGTINVVDDLEMSLKAQKGAYMGHLHLEVEYLDSSYHVGPHESWECYTAEASWSLGNGNLASGWTRITDGVDAFIHDYGPNNTSAGHRDGLLGSNVRKVGIGSTSHFYAIVPDSTGDLTGMWTWPPAGYIPSKVLYSGALNPPRWSIRNEKAWILWKAKEVNGGVTPSVSVKNAKGESLDITNIKLANNKLLTWEVDIIPDNILNKEKYTVTISNYYITQKEGDSARTGTLTTYQYEVNIFNPDL